MTDLAILAEFRDLEEVLLPQGVANVEHLRALPKLRYISTRYDAISRHPAQTAEEFWKEYDAKKAAGK